MRNLPAIQHANAKYIMPDPFFEEHSYLKRLAPEAYLGYAAVHWSMTIADRKQGWLTTEFHSLFREILTHTAFRNGLLVPAYVLMPDHLHLLAMGYRESSDQRRGIRYLRKHLNRLLKPIGFLLQKQGYDHVIRKESRKRSLFQKVVQYIHENPLRANLVESPVDLPMYPYSGCVIPGYPEVNPWDESFWGTFWKLYIRLRENPDNLPTVDPSGKT